VITGGNRPRDLNLMIEPTLTSRTPWPAEFAAGGEWLRLRQSAKKSTFP
jgi:hypothetical protein